MEWLADVQTSCRKYFSFQMHYILQMFKNIGYESYTQYIMRLMIALRDHLQTLNFSLAERCDTVGKYVDVKS